MKKLALLSLPILVISLVACDRGDNNSAVPSKIVVANDVYDENPYYLAVCKLKKTDPDYRAYNLFKIDLNTDKTFTKSYLSSLISFNEYNDEDNVFEHYKSLTLAVQFDGTVITEYYVDFHQGDSSKIIKSSYDVLIVGDTVYRPYGMSIAFEAYYSNSDFRSDYEEIWSNGRLQDNFTIDANAVFPEYLPNGGYFVKESYAIANNYNIVSLQSILSLSKLFANCFTTAKQFPFMLPRTHDTINKRGFRL